MGIRNIKKQLIGKEDLELGFGQIVQERNGKNLAITRINAGIIPYTEDKSVSDVLDSLANYSVNSINELKTISNIEAINVLGYYEKGDGGGGTFYWDATSTETDNGGTIIQATGVTTGRWKRVFSGAVNVKWFGAKGDGITDDTIAIQNAISICDNLSMDGNFLLMNHLILTKSNIKLCMTKNSKIIIDLAFSGSEVFKIGFQTNYLVDGIFENLTVDFTNCNIDVDVFNFDKVARWIGRDINIINLIGTVFTETSVGHEHTWENITAVSAQVINGAGIYINMTDSYFTNLKSIGFSEYGIVNDGADNRFYGCHPWSYPRDKAGYSNFTTKISFWDKEDGMWDSCYADTFERENNTLPPSFSNGGIGFYFSKVSGNATMTNCGFYSLDTTIDSVIGVEASSVVQQLNLVNCRIVGSNSTAYEQFAKRNSTATAINLVGCNFSEFVYQAKEVVHWSDIVAGNQIYSRFLDNNEFTSLENNLKTFKDRRATYSTIVFKDETTSIDPYYWDYRENALKRIKGSDSWVTPTLLNGWVNSDLGGTPAQYRKDANGMVHIKGWVKDGLTTLGTSIFNLPVGYRPLDSIGFVQLCGASYNQQASIGVNSAGKVYVLSCPININVTLNLSFYTK